MAETTRDQLPLTIAAQIVWPLTLAAVVFGGSFAFACLFPFVAIAVVCAATMPARTAIATVAAAWVVNQVIGFTMMGYPQTANAFSWGAAIGAASVAAAVVALPIVGAGRPLSAVRLVAAFVAAFATYEGLLFAFAHYAGGLETFSADIVGLIARNDALWFAGLLVLRLALTGVAPRWFGAAPPLRFA